MRYKFNVGDKVRVLDGSKTKNYSYGWCMENTIDKEGTIVSRSIIEARPFYKIKFDDKMFERYDSCIFDERALEFVENRYINFVIIGRTVYSRMCDSNGEVSTSEARCHPDDDFDIKTGINIALDRLLAKASLYNGKIICVENDGPLKFSFTKGKIYNIVDGEIKDDDGMIPFKNTTSLDQFDKIKGLSFIPLVE